MFVLKKFGFAALVAAVCAIADSKGLANAEGVNKRKLGGKGGKKGSKKGSKGKALYFAETFDAVTYLPSQETREEVVWVDKLWEWDGSEDLSEIDTEIGTARGECSYLIPGPASEAIAGPGYCAWTFTVGEDKLTVLGDVDSMDWSEPKTLAVVGGTGYYIGAEGSLDVVLAGPIAGVYYYLYEIKLV